MLVIFISLALTQRYLQEQSHYIIHLVGTTFLMDFSDTCSWITLIAFEQTDFINLLHDIFRILVFASYYAILSLYVYYTISSLPNKTKRTWIPAHIALFTCILATIGWSISVFNGMFYRIDDGRFSLGPLYWFGQLGGYIILGIEALLTIRYRKQFSKQTQIVLLLLTFFPLLAVLLRLFLNNISFMPACISLSIILVYIFLHVESVQIRQQMELTLAQDRISLMIGKVQPHFIFNVLNSIYVLCDKNPQAGKQAISDFAHYLRTNLDVFEHNQTLIPFDKELEHVKHYINLEHMRFEDELKVNYDITRTDFSIPPLTIQPLVENAIKHGILKKKGGGLLSIATYSTQKNIVITVSDTGVGFDSTKEIDTTKHIGIANTRTRLSQACGATLSIKSTEGCGTVATITIPQERVLK